MYYDGSKLLSMKDINGEKPEIYICTTNRTGGKTTYFNSMLVNRFKKKGIKFGLIYRNKNELESCAEKFFGDIKRLKFQNDDMFSKSFNDDTFHKLYLNEEECGYAIPLNLADKIKKCSHLLCDCGSLIFDEFQSETNTYVPNEIKKLISIHTSLARGNGEFVRYLPLYLVGNDVSLLNPYYIELGISDRLKEETKFLKGDGWVMERGFIEGASNAQKSSAFNRAFKNNKYVAFGSQNIYLNDNNTFIEDITGVNKYLCTIKCDGKMFAIREFANQGLIYVDQNADYTFPTKIAVTTDDHQINFVMLRQCIMIVSTLRYYFEKGCFRFKNLECKNAILKLLSY